MNIIQFQWFLYLQPCYNAYHPHLLEAEDVLQMSLPIDILLSVSDLDTEFVSLFTNAGIIHILLVFNALNCVNRFVFHSCNELPYAAVFLDGLCVCILDNTKPTTTIQNDVDTNGIRLTATKRKKPDSGLTDGVVKKAKHQYSTFQVVLHSSSMQQNEEKKIDEITFENVEEKHESSTTIHVKKKN
ncbi:hypothetical protein RFI_00348 [Reticulomyxa filosa]|uniref:Uncharacterized protein n=1 Tax=Reticulomyxa filosa TaxID=46433 RepID=X6PF80_RETFI|nr:hypothetical protein RFI_00348 [Reticulomyxa filosa]|eukprot:ETO36714.1 hypothetical protein RFI_00348 [Reticulomyxa filosa]